MPERIKIGEEEYTILFPDMMRPLMEREYQDLKNSIRKRGIENPVIVDQHGGIIDGANRARIASELGFPTLHCRVVRVSDPEAQRQLALSLNLDRRHLSADERAKMTEERRERVKEMKRAGMPTRQIAAQEGVSQSTIVRDLAQADVSDAGDALASSASDAEREKRREQVRQAKEEGLSTRQIAEKIGVDQSTIVRDLQKVTDKPQESDPEADTETVEEEVVEEEEEKEEEEEEEEDNLTPEQTEQLRLLQEAWDNADEEVCRAFCTDYANAYYISRYVMRDSGVAGLFA